jgi:polyisoprenyl-phosphate glycosyltransferase
MSKAETPNVRTISVIVPVYYNQASLAKLFIDLKDFEEKLTQRQMALELIFVDDGSGDGSLLELMKIKQARSASKVIKLTRNFGAVAASKTGFRFVSGDCFCILAADRQDPVAKILEMVDCWLTGEKFVVCARESREDPITTRFFAAIYYVAIRKLVAAGYPRGGFDLMLLDRTLLPYMIDSGKNTHPNLYAYWLGITPKILHYHREKRMEGWSRWTFRKKVKLFVDTVTGFSVTPLRLISAFGLAAATLSFVYGLYMFVNGLLGNIYVPGFATIIVLLTFFSGLILVMLGIIGEYLWRVFDATQKKPESVIDETFL